MRPRIPYESAIFNSGIIGPTGEPEEAPELIKRAVIHHAKIRTSGFTRAARILGGEIALTALIAVAFRSVKPRLWSFLDPPPGNAIPFYRLLSKRDGLGQTECHIRWCIFDRDPPAGHLPIFCLEISISRWRLAPALDLFEKSIAAPSDSHEVLLLEPTRKSKSECRRIGVGVIHARFKVFDKLKPEWATIV